MPVRSSASMRTEASTLKPPEPCPTRLRRVPRHTGGIDVVEESSATEVAEDAFLDNGLHPSDAIGRQVIGLVKRDLVVVGLAEDVIEDDEVVVGVDVEGGAEAMKEADGSELGARRRCRAGAPERPTLRAGAPRIARRKIRSTAPATRTSWWR